MVAGRAKIPERCTRPGSVKDGTQPYTETHKKAQTKLFLCLWLIRSPASFPEASNATLAKKARSRSYRAAMAALTNRSHRPRGLQGVGCGLIPPKVPPGPRTRPGFRTAPYTANDDRRSRVPAPATAARYLLSWESWAQARQYGALYVAAHLACAGTEARRHNRTLHLWPSVVCKYPATSGPCTLEHPGALGRVEQLFDLEQVSDMVDFSVANHTVPPEHTAQVNEHCASEDAAAIYPTGGRAVLLRRLAGSRGFPGCGFGHGMSGVQLAAALALQLQEKPRSPQAVRRVVAQACLRLEPEAGCAGQNAAHVRLLARLLLSSRINPLHSTRGWVETRYTHAMAMSFRRHRRVSIPAVRVADLEQKRAALDRLLRERLSGSRPETNVAQPDVQVGFGEFCPRSLGNIVHTNLNAMLLAVVLGAKVVFPHKHEHAQLVCDADLHCTTCNGLLGFKAGAWVRDQNISRHNSVYFDECTDIQRLVTSAATAATAANSYAPRGMAHTHQLAECLAYGQSESAAATTLFALGAHVAYGAMLASTVLLANATSMPEDADELRVSVHLRHCALMRVEPPPLSDPDRLTPIACAAVDENFSGAEGIDAVESAVRNAVRNAARGTKRCALLAASDRMLTLHLLKGVAGRVGCRLVLSPRDPSEQLRSHGRVLEHGLETSGVVVRDAFLLSRGDVVIGTWGSTLTMLIQELAAARSDGRVPPTVTYCELSLNACMAPLPLHTTRRNAWHITISSSHGVKLRRSGRDLRPANTE